MWLNYLINLVVGVVEAILGFRFILKLFGANSGAPFVRWIYDMSRPLLQPFAGMFPSPVTDGRYVLEFTTLFAILVYALVAYLLTELLRSLHWAVEHRTHP